MQVGRGGGGCCSEVSGVLAKKVSASLDLKGQHKGGCTFYFLLCKAWLYFLSAPMGTWVVEGPTFFLCSGGMRASCRREGGGTPCRCGNGSCFKWNHLWACLFTRESRRWDKVSLQAAWRQEASGVLILKPPALLSPDSQGQRDLFGASIPGALLPQVPGDSGLPHLQPSSSETLGLVWEK